MYHTVKDIKEIDLLEWLVWLQRHGIEILLYTAVFYMHPQFLAAHCPFSLASCYSHQLFWLNRLVKEASAHLCNMIIVQHASVLQHYKWYILDLSLLGTNQLQLKPFKSNLLLVPPSLSSWALRSSCAV